MAVLDNIVQVELGRDASLGGSRRVRVLLVITGLAAGGATNVVLDIARHLSDHPGFTIDLLTGPPPPGRTDVTDIAYALGIKTRVIPSLINKLDPITNLRAVAEIRKIIVEGRYEVVHTHSSVAGVVGRLAALTAGTPVILHHVHGWPPYHKMSAGTQMLYLTLERLCAKFTTRVIAVSGADIKKGLAYRICREDKFSLIYNGVDLDKFCQSADDYPIRQQLRIDPQCKLVGMVGRLDQQKNPLDFIRAAAIVAKNYSNVQFLMIGDGNLRGECERLISELHLTHKVHLLGYRSDVARIMPILTIVAMTSLWEGLPLAFLEAMCAGKPIVAYDVDGVSDVVIDWETGFLVPPCQPEKLAERLLYLLENDSQRHEMGRVAQQRSANFSVQRMVGQVESLYKDLCSAVQPRVIA
jgi:glycosyltransferase involved in cell wall biosynthesis